MLHIEYTVTPGMRLARQGMRLRKRRVAVVLRCVGALIFLYGVFLLSQAPPAWRGFSLVLTVGGVLVLVELDLLLWLRVRRHRDALLRESHVVIDDDAIRQTTSVSNEETRWDAVERVMENKKLWLLVCGINQSQLVPKASLTTEQQREFAAFLTDNHVGARR